ncbi:MAG: sensor histidine kinase [Candidatus Limnocylindrales bacterium]
MTTDDAARAGGPTLAELLASNVEAIDRELTEIEMLANQVKTEAGRHEQRRAAAAERVAGATGDPALKDLVDTFNQLITLTKRATMMEAQAELLEAKSKSLARHRAALLSFGEIAIGMGGDAAVVAEPAAAIAADAPMPPSVSRVVLSAQEDLRREIARSMHDGPAQSLTNIVLQTQIVERLMDRDPAAARGEIRLLASMVQHTLDTTKNFIFDVRPMVLDDLGLVPTLRRSTRERGRRAHVNVEFESHGQDRRLSMELESTLFRMLDETLAAYLAQAPERVALTLEWGATEVHAVVSASRTPAYPLGGDLPPMPEGDVPDTMRRMIQDRHDAHQAAIAAAEAAAQLPLPPNVRRDLTERAAAVGASVEILDDGEVRITVGLAEAEGGDPS